MDLPRQFNAARQKVRGEDKAPWYTRWVWWVVIGVVGVGVFALWYTAKMREARLRASLRVANESAQIANIKALAEKDREKAAALRTRAIAHRAHATKLEAELKSSEAARKNIEVAIKGASSWKELEDIEKDLR